MSSPTPSDPMSDKRETLARALEDAYAVPEPEVLAEDILANPDLLLTALAEAGVLTEATRTSHPCHLFQGEPVARNSLVLMKDGSVARRNSAGTWTHHENRTLPNANGMIDPALTRTWDGLVRLGVERVLYVPTTKQKGERVDLLAPTIKAKDPLHAEATDAAIKAYNRSRGNTEPRYPLEVEDAVEAALAVVREKTVRKQQGL